MKQTEISSTSGPITMSSAPVMAGRDRYAAGPYKATDPVVSIWSDGRWVKVPVQCGGPAK